MFKAIAEFILHFTETFGYLGIFVMTALESTFLPIPSEATLIPAGYLIYQGKMNPAAVFVLSVLGSLTGSLANYWIARLFGRPLLLKYGRFFLIDEEKLRKVEGFFSKHGQLSILLGRLVFGVRHFISFPAGLGLMNLGTFCLYTCIGCSIWTAILLGLGYGIGGNEHLLASIVPALKVGMLAAVVLAVYVYRRKIAARRAAAKS